MMEEGEDNDENELNFLRDLEGSSDESDDDELGQESGDEDSYDDQDDSKYFQCCGKTLCETWSHLFLHYISHLNPGTVLHLLSFCFRQCRLAD